ncbi:MAG: phosphoglucosamine mutase [Firmicutes bacterium]|nr:phosphoglucosamine mutase [Bacillota bacterium]
MEKLFGTDGIRGVANRELTPEMTLRIGRIIASMLGRSESRPVILIGRDTRISGAMLEGSLSAGITSAGAAVRLLGIAPTPAVAYLIRSLKATAGIVISASHNPIEDNGLKIFDRDGLKLPDEMEKEIERIYFQYEKYESMLLHPEGTEVGAVMHDGEALESYLQYLKKAAPSLEGLHLVVDCGHGAACRLARELLQQMGADVELLHGVADGGLINVNCGATDTTELQREVVRCGADAGLAFDGDADRLIAVDEKGAVIDGDAIMSICAIAMAGQGRLNKNTLVATVMSNGGLDLLAEEYGFKLRRTSVGDRYVLEEMLTGGYNLGGEQSGHIIFSDHATTGDGLLAALQLMAIVRDAGRPLSELAGRLKRLPQVLYNQPVILQKGWEDNPAINSAIEDLRGRLGRHSRVLVRPSGTEPLIRIMLEAPLPEDKLWKEARDLAEIIVREKG